MAPTVEQIEVLITVKAAPEISTSYGETVCVAGVRCDQAKPSWVRLFPVPFAAFHGPGGFKKYDRLRISVTRHPPGRDHRPESRRPDLGSVERLDHLTASNAWRARNEVLSQLPRRSMCRLIADKGVDRQSLALVRPAEVFDLEVEDLRTTEAFSRKEAQALVTQFDLFSETTSPPIELCPVRFRYHYRCDEPGCAGNHHQSIVDWELSEAWRTWPNEGEADLLDQIRRKWLVEMCGPKRDTQFFVGNQHKSPQAFMVLGVYWPPRLTDPGAAQLALEL